MSRGKTKTKTNVDAATAIKIFVQTALDVRNPVFFDSKKSLFELAYTMDMIETIHERVQDNIGITWNTPTEVLRHSTIASSCSYLCTACGLQPLHPDEITTLFVYAVKSWRQK